MGSPSLMSNATQHSESTHNTLLDIDEVPPVAADTSPLLDPTKSESSDNPTPKLNGVHRRTGENQTIVWLLLTTPLILHFLSVIVLTVAIKFYISGHSSNLDSRRVVTTFVPLQSDITTAISHSVSILRIFTTMWSTSTAWGCAFILMENGGVSLEQINRLLTWRIHFNSSPISSRKAQVGALISVILLATFSCQLSGLILTGSITWTPSHGYMGGKSIKIAGSFTIPDWSEYDSSNPHHRVYRNHSQVLYASIHIRDVLSATHLASLAWLWQRSLQDDERAMKCVTFRVPYLPINSTLSDIALPYFAVTKLEWIKDPWTELPEKVIPSLKSTSIYNPFNHYQDDMDYTHVYLPYNFALISDEPTPSPNPFTGTVTETHILAGLYSQSALLQDPCSAQSPFDKIPLGFASLTAFRQIPLAGCYIFAWVTYVAGASRCTNCRVSSWLTIQNDTSLTILPDMMTVDVLDIMPHIAVHMAATNVSVPESYNNLDGYVTGLLTRLYRGAWNYLMDSYVSVKDVLVKTDVQIAVPTSKANVLWRRVLLWLMLNMIFILSGLLFLFCQTRCSQPVVVDAPVAALLLDTSDVLHKKNRAFCNFLRLVKDDEDISYLELRQEPEYGGHRRVVVVKK